ncbi:Protein 21.1 [Giardia lamblia P15]|uniref:Protein 21.1 n=1 Tax=Giardia intestinalis (strain P15) TaxID=658858 RepID=E1F3P5_GIAIA|nr:Protein 21.1 [Giardia lamblia P15]
MYVFCWELSSSSAVRISRLTGLPEDMIYSVLPQESASLQRILQQHRTLARLPGQACIYRIEIHNDRKTLCVVCQHYSVRLSLAAMCTESSKLNLSHSECICILTALLALILEVGTQYPNIVQFLEEEQFFMTPTGSITVEIPIEILLSSRQTRQVRSEESMTVFARTYLTDSLSNLIAQFVTCYVRMFYYRKATLSKAEIALPNELQDLIKFNDILRSLSSFSRNSSINMLTLYEYMQTSNAQVALAQMEVSRGIERDPVFKTTQLHRAIKSSDIPGIHLYSRLYGGIRDISGQTGLHYLAGLGSNIIHGAILNLLPLEVQCEDRIGYCAGSYFLQLERYEEAALLSFFEPLIDDRHNSIFIRLIDDITTLGTGQQGISSMKSFLVRTRFFSSLIESQSHSLLVNLLSNQLGIRGAKGRTALIAAVQGGHKELVAALAFYESSISDLEGDGYALAHAMYKGSSSIVELLTSLEASVLLTTGFTSTMICAASPLPPDSNISGLLRSEELRKRTSKGWTALMFAAVAGNLQAVKQLAHSEAGLTNYEGQTAGTLAYLEGHMSIAEWLSRFETVRDSAGDTLLHKACREYVKDPTDGKLLDVRCRLSMANEYTENGDLAISLAIKERCNPLIKLLDLEYRTRLPEVSYSSRISHRNFHNATPLMLAALLCLHNLPEAMIAASARMQDNEGFTALMCAARSGCIELVQRLIPYEGKMQTESGFTALMCAAQEGHIAVVQMLLEVGCESAIQDKNGNTALFRALRNGHDECSKILLPSEYNLNNNSGVSMLMIAAESNTSPSLFSSLVASQYNQLQRQQLNGKTALMCAAAVNNISAVTVLLQKEHSGEVGMQDEQGFTALMYAASTGHAEMCRLLAPYESGIRAVKEQTAAMLAAEAGHLECLSVLLPIEGTLKKNSGWSLVHSAAVGGSIEVLSMLAPTPQELIEGTDSPLSLAKKHFRHKMVDYIEACLQKQQ